VAQGTGQVTFSAPGGTGDKHIFTLQKIAPFYKGGQLLFGKVAGGRAFDLFGRSGQPQFGQFKIVSGFFVGPAELFGLYQLGNQVVPLELLIDGELQLLAVTLVHTLQA
jgi:hypothetical protein